MQIKDKVAIVTGASEGIGLAAAKLLSRKGAKVVLVSRSKNKLESIARKLPFSIAIPADMSKPTEIKNMVKKTIKHFGRIDILINNAGQGYDAPVENIRIDSFRKVFDLDLVGPIVAMQEVIPVMRRYGQGVIVNISSGTALMYLENMGAYASLKRALAHISLTAREELKKDHISVSVVYPYITDTNFEKNTIKDLKSVTRKEQGENSGFKLPPADSPEFVAEKILEAITTEKGEIFVHDWMKKMAV